MSKEEIEEINEILSCNNCPTSYACEACDITWNDKKLLKKYIRELKQENDKKNKIIGEMSKYLAEISDCPREMFKIDLDCEERCGDKDTDIKCWKLYFEEKVDDKNVENKR